MAISSTFPSLEDIAIPIQTPASAVGTSQAEVHYTSETSPGQELFDRIVSLP